MGRGGRWGEGADGEGRRWGEGGDGEGRRRGEGARGGSGFGRRGRRSEGAGGGERAGGDEEVVGAGVLGAGHVGRVEALGAEERVESAVRLGARHGRERSLARSDARLSEDGAELQAGIQDLRKSLALAETSHAVREGEPPRERKFPEGPDNVNGAGYPRARKDGSRLLVGQAGA